MGSDAELIRRLTDEVFVEGDIAKVDELLADTFVDHDPMPGVPGTKDGMRQIAEMVVATFSDRKAEMDEYLETTDGRVVENWAMSGRHTGDGFLVPPSGEEIRVRGMEIWRCADDKVVEHWGVVDMSDVFMKASQAPA